MAGQQYWGQRKEGKMFEFMVALWFTGLVALVLYAFSKPK